MSEQKSPAERYHDKMDEWWASFGENAVESGQMAARMIIVVNGAAAIAVLAFAGNAIGRMEGVDAVVGSLTYFAAGSASGTFAIGAAYAVNYAAQSMMGNREKIREFPYWRETGSSGAWRKFAGFGAGIAFIAGLIGLMLFVIGLLDVKSAILLLKPLAGAGR